MWSRLPAPKLSTPQRFTEVATRTSPAVSRIRPRRSGSWVGGFRWMSRKGFAAPSSGRGPTRGTSKGQRSDHTMKLVLAAYGTRGDVEPSVVVGRELVRRGHDVRIAVPPNQVGFAEAAGLSAVAYGPDSQEVVEKDFGTKLFEDFPHRAWRIKDLKRMWRENWELSTQCWSQMGTTLTSLAQGV